MSFCDGHANRVAIGDGERPQRHAFLLEDRERVSKQSSEYVAVWLTSFVELSISIRGFHTNALVISVAVRTRLSDIEPVDVASRLGELFFVTVGCSFIIRIGERLFVLYHFKVHRKVGQYC